MSYLPLRKTYRAVAAGSALEDRRPADPASSFDDGVAEQAVIQRRLQSILEQACTKTGATGAAVAILSTSGLVCQASCGTNAPKTGSVLDPEVGFSGLCFRTGDVLLCSDSQNDPRVDAAACNALGVRALIAVPVKDGGTVIGVLELFSPEAGSFSSSQFTVLQQLAEDVAKSRKSPIALEIVHDSAEHDDPEAMPTLITTADESSTVDESPSGRVLFDSTEVPGTDFQHPLWRTKRWQRILFAITITWAGLFGYKIRINSARSSVKPRTIVKAEIGSPAPVITSVADEKKTFPPAGMSVLSTTVDQVKANIRGVRSAADLSTVRVAAVNGDANSQYELGIRYASGSDVPQDYAEAMRWFQKAAERGNAQAQWRLGLGYLKGIGVDTNEQDAAGWFKRAANRGYPPAQVALSELYLDGRGVPTDLTRSYTWASIGMSSLKSDTQKLQAIQARMTPAEMKEANRRIKSWWQSRGKRP